MRKVIFYIIAVIILILLAAYINGRAAEKIYFNEKFEYGGIVSAPDSLHYIVYGNNGPIDVEKQLVMTDADTTYFDSVSGSYAGYANLQLRTHIYDDSVSCAPCEIWQWVRQTQTFYNIGPASGDSTTMMWAIITDGGSPVSGARLVLRYMGSNIEDTCNNTIIDSNRDREGTVSLSDGISEIETTQSSCLRQSSGKPVKAKIGFKVGNRPVSWKWQDTIPGDVDSVRLTRF